MADELKTVPLTPALHAYLVAHGTPPDAAQQALIARTTELGGVAAMQVAPEQGALLTLLAKLVDARQAVEVGTFTGYSAIALARGLAPGGRLLCCDVSDEWTSIAREAWREAGVADRIDLRLGPAQETLDALPDEPTIDLAFLDADKTGYLGYYEALVPRLRPGGLLLADNVFQGGRVVDADTGDENVDAIRAFNDHVADDPRVEVVVLPVADGLTVARRTEPRGAR